MRLTATIIEGYEAYIDIRSDQGDYWVVVPALRDETTGTTPKFGCIDAAARAIKAYDLAQRKGFSNPTAYIEWAGQVRTVTVTSVSADGTAAWIRREIGNDTGRREKVSMSRLFADHLQLAEIIDRKQRADKQYVEEIAAAKRWEPEFAAMGVA